MADNTDDLGDLFQDVTGEESVTTEQEQTDSKLRGEESDPRSTTTVECPECGHDKAYVEMQQIRAADESETRFFECVNCEETWREDDH